MPDTTLEQLAAEYTALCHAMQSGVKALMERDEKETSPKHLRVGVNSALSDCSALAKLLLKKGVITELEYYEAIRDGMAAEVKSYEITLSELFGTKITLA